MKRWVNASGSRVAIIVSAGIVVVTRDGSVSASAIGAVTGIIGALAVVIANDRCEAAFQRIDTCISGAVVIVIAGKRFMRACSSTAVIHRTGVAVGTIHRCVRADAGTCRALVGCAEVSIIAVFRGENATVAGGGVTCINSTRVVVIA